MAETQLPVKALDENTRRYYLDVMGIQCWELLAAEKQHSEDSPVKNAGKLTDDGAGDDRDVVPVQLAANEAASWALLETKVQQCTQCSLHKTRKQAILGRGNQSAALMIILLSPDMIDEISGLLCDAEAYELLSKMLNAIDIRIDDVYITSLLKCALPPRHTVSPKELHQCDAYLKQQIQLIRPKQLVILGETAARCLLQKDKPLDDLRALINSDEKNSISVLAQYESVPLVVSYAPQELLQRPENKRKAWQDLQQLQKMIQRM
jgi:DNA polymerase